MGFWVILEQERSAWRYGRFRAFAAGNALNNIGESMYALALPLLAYDLTGSLRVMALLAALYPLVITIGGPLLGVAVDRFGSGYFVLPGLLLQIVSVLVLTLVLMADAQQIWMLAVSELLVQTGAVSYRAGWMAGLPSMFPTYAARSRGALLTVYQASVVAGPAIAAVLIDPLGIIGLLWINLVTFIAPIIVWLLGINPVSGQQRDSTKSWNVVGDLADGWRVLRSSRQAFSLILMSIPFDFIMCNGTIALFLYYLRDDLELSPGIAGAVIAAANVGAFAGALFASERPARSMGVVCTTGLLACAACFFVLPVTTSIAVTITVLVLIFVVTSWVEVAASMVIYSAIPEHIMGRTTGFSRLIGGFSSFLSPLIVASLDPLIGVRGAFLMLGGAAALPGFWLLANRGRFVSAQPSVGENDSKPSGEPWTDDVQDPAMIVLSSSSAHDHQLRADCSSNIGLEQGPLAGPWTLESGELVSTIRSRTPWELAAIVESDSPELEVSTRLFAGTVLSMIGDPRLTSPPAVCQVLGGVATVGLHPDDLEAVVAEWAHVGVKKDWIEKECPAHDVYIEDFWIAKYPVTNCEYLEFLRASDHDDRPSTWYLGAYPWDRGNHPVAGVGIASAMAYVKWISARDQHPWRLPTESEWEYAAGGPDRREYPWGDTFDPSKANTRETGLHSTTPVGMFTSGRASCGAFDIAGNVEEFTADIYKPYPGGRIVSDDLLETVGEYRVTRGGSFARFGDLARTRRRHGPHPGPLYPIGFRLATSRPPESCPQS